MLSGPSAHAQVSIGLDDRALAARVNGEPVYAFSVDAIRRLPREKSVPLSRTKTLESIIVNRLLATKARSLYKEDELYRSQRIAFAHDVALDDQLMATLRALYGKEIEAALQALPAASLDSLIVEQARIEPAELDRIFGNSDKLQLEYALGSEQIAAAKRLVLLRYSLPQGQSGTISLYDVYHRQNVQGRVELYMRNQGFMQQQAKTKLASLFVQHWANRKFSTPAVADLRRTLSDQNDVQALMRLHGIGHDMHAESKYLDGLAKQVSAAEIATYYRDHKDEFKRIERVKARHISVPDEVLAKRLAAAAAKGEDFGGLARRHSIAADAQTGGDLGWIVHEGSLSWLAQLAFMQAEGQVSPPFRTPVGPNETALWEIVLVEKRLEGYQPATSESVRYAASNAIAEQKALVQFKAMREQLLRSARIEINRQALDEPIRLTANKS
jgi:parvulin-like peptidyl-prolyl isomerase